MTGPEHYRQAEHLALLAADHLNRYGGDDPEATGLTGVAQVHATLALAAATALPLLADMTKFGDMTPGEAWREVIA